MALKNNSGAQSAELNFIGKGTHIEGNIKTESSIHVAGTIKGKLICKHTVTVSENGQVEGDIEAVNAVIGGRVKGKVNVNEKIVLEPKSSLVGELKAKKLIIDEGAVFDGTADMGITNSSIPKNTISQVEKGNV
ncbi:MAG: polymer-forming cytoskeletal protein [Calditrichaeota bacterium]|nr:MAG: polymer-forming cytoskeletal protein [Calditrichota bacterium]MBL1206694.1 polymer-forming cytoskeletal protein [Calditrichota bacterium]NOG46521.1 polymer-forming cytoskeletal protein [Calditrichota bacterium]